MGTIQRQIYLRWLKKGAGWIDFDSIIVVSVDRRYSKFYKLLKTYPSIRRDKIMALHKTNFTFSLYKGKRGIEYKSTLKEYLSIDSQTT